MPIVVSLHLFLTIIYRGTYKCHGYSFSFTTLHGKFNFPVCSKERTGVDRFSLRQAVIFICATNRPDELDLEFVRAGRIDRRVYIGLPDAKQRVQMFGVHSTGRELAEDVNFEKVLLNVFSAKVVQCFPFLVVLRRTYK